MQIGCCRGFVEKGRDKEEGRGLTDCLFLVLVLVVVVVVVGGGGGGDYNRESRSPSKRALFICFIW